MSPSMTASAALAPVSAVPRPRVSADTLIKLAAGVLVAYLALSPLLFLLQSAFTEDGEGGFSLANMVKVFTDRRAPGLLGNSAVFALGSTALAMVLGTGLAYLHARTDVSGKGLIFAVALMPMAVPGIMYASAWIVLGRPGTGILNMPFHALGLDPVNIFSMPGMIWIEGTNLASVVFLMMLAAFRASDPGLEESALTHGAGRWETFFRVSLPLVRPAMLGAALLTVVRALESFEVPALVGQRGGIWVYTSMIYHELNNFPTDMGLVSAYAFLLVLIAVVLMAAYTLHMRRRSGRAVETIGGKGFRARPSAIRGWGRAAANAFVWLYIVSVVILPTAALVYSSLLPLSQAPTLESFGAMTLDGYASVLTNAHVRTGALNSVLLAVASATIVMVLVSVVAWVVVKGRGRGRWVLDQLTFFPVAFPGIALGLAILFVYLRVPIGVYGTLGILLIAYVTKFMPFGMRYATSAMHQIGGELEEAARVSKANWAQTFRRVVLPLILPAFIAGWIYVAMISVRELSSSIILYSADTEVLGVAMWNLAQNGDLSELNALGFLLMVVLVLGAWGLQRLTSRFGVQQA